MSTHTNARLDRAGWRLQHQTAILAFLALDHLATELAYLSITPGKGGDQLGVSGGGPTVRVDEDDNGPNERIDVSPVEAAVMRAHDLRERREELRDRIDGLELAIAGIDQLTRQLLGTRVPRTIPELCDGRARGYEGHMLAWVPYSKSDDNGWHDPACRDASGPTGLCDACLVRMNRWRERNGHPRVASDARSEVVGRLTHVA
ncbi:MAG: hypothetical protein WCC60_06625 [Ilumatobacteraceae bacterium]